MEGIELDALAAVHHEVNQVAAPYFDAPEHRSRFAILSGPLAQPSGPARRHAGAHAIALVAGVIQLAVDADDAVPRRAPSANGRVVLIVADVAAVRIQNHPAQFGVRQIRSAL